MKPVDNEARRMLHDLGRALVEAASSSEVSQTIRRIREQGYSIHLVLEPKESSERRAQIELTTRDPRPAPREPAYLLDGQDVSFLRSLGIDPTRQGRRRRGS